MGKVGTVAFNPAHGLELCPAPTHLHAAAAAEVGRQGAAKAGAKKAAAAKKGKAEDTPEKKLTKMSLQLEGSMKRAKDVLSEIAKRGSMDPIDDGVRLSVEQSLVVLNTTYKKVTALRQACVTGEVVDTATFDELTTAIPTILEELDLKLQTNARRAKRAKSGRGPQ